ncbi:hypothetical protein QYF36_026615 [Acer negundo]|nr:hypothetical protein QYF36_026615 [Acer negundo]
MVENLEVCCVEHKQEKKREAKAWIPPLFEALKFNVDGSFNKEQGRAGIGGVLRNSKGENMFGGREIVIESDSRVVIAWILSTDFGNLAMVDEIYEIRAKLRTYNNLSIHYVSRVSNGMADGLAKRGSVLEGENVVWSVF